MGGFYNSALIVVLADAVWREICDLGRNILGPCVGG